MNNVNETPEATYVRGLLWETDGYSWVCKNVSETVRAKLKDIFDRWQIGYHSDTINCKGNSANVYVTARQFWRVQFSFDKTTTENPK
jgi:hypothetical protein